MKGIIFNTLEELVEEKFGFEMWDSILNSVELESEGIYSSVGTYDDAELFAIVGKLSEKTKVSIRDLVITFGTYLAPKLQASFPVFFEPKNYKDFLKNVHDVIHVEVRKLYPEAGLPEITYEDPSENELVMNYFSERKLCALGEGLIQGTANVYKQNVEIKHTKCLLNNDDCCRFELSFS